jgi:Icc-related predicted phosphoesterase
MKILHISDTHGYHAELEIPKVDMIIHSGDISNSRVFGISINECIDFLNWYRWQDVKYKILVAGNHDTWAARDGRSFRKECRDRGITYLENELVEVEGIKIFGSPITPTFNDWSFMKNRSKLYEFWENCFPEEIDILVTHGPPYGVLDTSIDKNHRMEFCGDKSLYKHILRVKPKWHLFGHIHSLKNEVINNGIREIPYVVTKFSNATCLLDGGKDGIVYNGNIINYE